MDTQSSLSVSYGGQRQPVPTSDTQTLRELSGELSRLFGVDEHTIKLLQPKGKAPVLPSEHPEELTKHAGAHNSLT